MAQAAPESDSEGYSSENENFKEIIRDQDDALGAFLDNFERFAHWDPNFANDLKDELLKFVHLCYRAMGWFDMGDSDWGPIIEEHCQIEWAAEDNDIHGPSYGAAAQQHTPIRDSLWFYENKYRNGIHQAASEEDPLPMHWASLMRIATLRLAWVHPTEENRLNMDQATIQGYIMFELGRLHSNAEAMRDADIFKNLTLEEISREHPKMKKIFSTLRNYLHHFGGV